MGTDVATAGCYVHVPFCEAKCPYCAFFSEADRENLIPAYLDALAIEIDRSAHEWCTRDLPPFDTIFLGGGTPSMLTPAQIARILDHLASTLSWRGEVEVTMECNPGSSGAATLRAYREAGVTRLSIGVQSFQPRHLEQLGRIHSRDEALSTVIRAHEAGFEHLSLDLMYDLPDQREDELVADLRELVALPLDHCSLYSLTPEPGTPGYERYLTTIDADRAADFAAIIRAYLVDHGFARYEVSNYARPGGECRHNVHYWCGDAYLNLGPAAVGAWGAERRRNVSSTQQWIAHVNANEPSGSVEPLTEDQRRFERLFLGLRSTSGVRFEALSADYACDARALLESVYAPFEKRGLVTLTPGALAPTPDGLDFADELAIQFERALTAHRHPTRIPLVAH